jgi:CubicO group peptidase (beta-lactamase class C family)
MRWILLLLLTGCSLVEVPSDDDDSSPPDDDDSFPLDTDGVTDELEGLRELAALPGAAACVTDGDQAWCAVFGYADVDNEVLVEPETAFLLASVTKTVTAASVMQRVEDGLVGLDDDINDVLAWPIAHPTSAGAFTLTGLMAHTASITDNWDSMDDFYTRGGDPTITLAEAVRGYFEVAGEWYDADDNFGDWAIDERVEYSNMGVALEGYVAEVAAGERFDILVEEDILDPLGMEDSGWWLADFTGSELAIPHGPRSQGFQPYDPFTFADYPNGGLRCSAPDLARFGAAIAQGGVLDGTRILSEGSVDTMLESVAMRGTERVARGWFYADELGEGWIGHDGGEDGTNTVLYVNPTSQRSVVLLANGDVENWGAWEDMVARLIAVATD